MEFKIFAFTLFCLISSVICLSERDCKCRVLPNKRIIGGRQSQVYPWLASVFVGQKGKQIELIENNTTFPEHVYRNLCGASVLNEQWLISAASCLPASLDKDSLKTISIGVGSENDLVTMYQNGLYSVEKVVVHPEFKKSLYYTHHDLALIKINGSLRFYQNVQPACFDLREQFLYDGFLDIAGHGSKTSPLLDTRTNQIDNFTPSRYLREGQTQDWSLYAYSCVKRMKELICVNSPIMKNSFCIGEAGSSLHQQTGDGKSRVIGIASVPHAQSVSRHQVKMCSDDGADITRLSHYEDFIRENILENYCYASNESEG